VLSSVLKVIEAWADALSRDYDTSVISKYIKLARYRSNEIQLNNLKI